MARWELALDASLPGRREQGTASLVSKVSCMAIG
jgi:hypothetical protein